MSQRAVDEKRCELETRRAYMAKLDRIKNDNEVAYQFFRFGMCLDLSNFHVDEPLRTQLFEEQRSHNECALKRFLEDVQSGEYVLKENELPLPAGKHTFKTVELFGHLRRYVQETGVYSSVDSTMSLGHALKGYPDLAPKVVGNHSYNRYTITIPAHTRV